MKLSKAQRDVLEWLGTQPDGVTDIHDKRVVNALINKGCAEYVARDDIWRITEAGRVALRTEAPDGN